MSNNDELAARHGFSEYLFWRNELSIARANGNQDDIQWIIYQAAQTLSSEELTQLVPGEIWSE